jgi:hypothetical protein
MIFLIAIAFLFFFEGVRSTARFVIWIFQWKQSQEWLSARGKIIQSALQSVFVPQGGRKSRNIDGSVRLATAYVPDVLYEYRANTESFQSRQIFLGQQFPTSLRLANDFVDKYPIGKEVTVFYNPEKPEVAVLERDWHKELLGHLGRGLLFIFFGFAILIYALQQ